MAVGVASGAAGTQTLAEMWNGIQWTVEPTPNAVGTDADGLFGVSCWSRRGCTAVGGYSTLDSLGAPDGALVEHWDGAAWSLQSVTASSGNILYGVSCATGTFCVAVGGSDVVPVLSGAITPSLAERWNGIRWSVQTTPVVRAGMNGGPSLLRSVSCASTIMCTAVGIQSGNDPLVERWIHAFAVTHVRASADGTLTAWVVAPGPGRIDVLETAWDDNVARIALLQPAKNRIVFARGRATATTAGIIPLSVMPNRRGRFLVSHHRYRVTLRLWVTYSPVGGGARSRGIYGLHLDATTASLASMPAAPG